MSRFTTRSLLLFAALASCSPKKQSSRVTEAAPEATSAIDFSWRRKIGEFPKDKPGYLILTTEDALIYSKVLPEFVKQKESMGFYVYVATEKDYGTGKTGNEQAARVRIWMREFNKRAGLKYALLIGNSNARSTDLPSPTIPDGERGGFEPSYCDLDGKWVDLYLNITEKDPRPHNEQIQGSMFLTRSMKEGGKRQDELIVSRISYIGNEIGNGAYDLDRILEKTIRYERDTVAGKNLDWRANSFSITSNYGAGDWDAPWLKAAQSEGGTFELRSTRGWLGSLPPENVIDGRALNAELLSQTRRRGLLATMSHGWNRGCEGIVGTEGLLSNLDPRYPSVVSVAACTGFALADNGNLGQSWLRSGAIFANGTGWSANNNCRVPLHTRQLLDRVSVGEAGKNEVVQYGDPSLHVLPPKGKPARALQVSPALAGYYEERTTHPNTPVKPLTQTYTLTNRSESPMKITVETDAPWLALSTKSIALKPGDSAQVTATSNEKMNTLAPGKHVADVRFRREDGQVDDRRLAISLQPLSVAACYSFEPEQGDHFPDLTVVPGFDRDIRSLWLVTTKPGDNRKMNPSKDRVPGFDIDPQGKVGGALRLDKPKAGWSRGRAFGSPQWRGISTSFWFKLDELPAAKQTTAIMAAPFALSVDPTGLVTFAGNGKPANLGKIKTGEWHFVQLRTDLEKGKVKASLDGTPEVQGDATQARADALNLGSFAGGIDELKVWSGELTNALVVSEFAAAGQAMKLPEPAPPTGAIALVEDSILHAPKEIPVVLDLKDPSVQLDIAGALAANQLTCTGLRDAPEWLDFKNGVFSLKPGTNFDRIDFGGYDLFLILTAKSGPFAGCVCEHPLKVRIPVPEVRIRIARAADNTLSIASAGGDKKPLAKGVIRYTTDGSPVTLTSPIYDKPFKTEGDKVTARFFFLGEYPYMPVTMASEFGMPRDKWKVLAISGKGGVTANVIDGRTDTAWKNVGGVLPQFFAWDLGAATPVTAISVHSTIKDANGRIKGYALHASDDGKTWRKLQEGELESSPNALRIKLEATCSARYLKLEATSLHEGPDMVLTEIEAYTR